MGDHIMDGCVRGHDGFSKPQRVEAWRLIQPFTWCA
jgi:hypothetical protein